MKTVILSFDDSRLDFYTNVFPLLKEFNVPATLNVIPDFVNHPSVYSFPSGNDEAMTHEQIVECYESGLVEMACHGHTHKNTKEDVVENLRCLRDIIVDCKIGFASPTSAVTWENKNSSGLWDLVEQGELSYIRSGIRIRREGMFYVLLSVLDSRLHSDRLFWYLNKRTINPARLKVPFLSSSTVHSYTKPHQIKHFIKKAKSDSTIILMFHSVKKRGEKGYGADRFYYDYNSFREILAFLNSCSDVNVMKTIDFVTEGLKLKN